jgi:hypothetical protein
MTNGIVQWTAGLIELDSGTFVNNGTFSANNSGGKLGFFTVGFVAFQNSPGATFTRLGSDSVAFYADEFVGVSFNNSAAVNLSAGALMLGGGGSHSGDFVGAPGVTLGIGGDHTFAAGSDLLGNLRTAEPEVLST